MKKYLITFFFISSLCFGKHYCKIGQSTDFTFENWIESKSKIKELSLKISSSNPTIFYIDSIKINDNIKATLKRNYFDIECKAKDINSNQIDLAFYGTGLAGNDTITTLSLSDVYLDNKFLKQDTSITIISKHNLIDVNYAKFVKISNVKANVVFYKSQISIEYFVDLPVDVKVSIFNELGETVWHDEFYKEKIGKDEILVNLGNQWSAGKYWIFLETDIGSDFSSFIVIK